MLLRLLGARLAALGSSVLAGREAGPLGSSVQPTGRPAMAPRLLELAASKAADVTPPPLTMQVGEVDFRYFEETPMAARARYAMPYRALEPRTSRQQQASSRPGRSQAGLHACATLQLCSPRASPWTQARRLH